MTHYMRLRFPTLNR
ncbi:erythromycin resistance leader peptide [Thermoflavimicrobium daqui]